MTYMSSELGGTITLQNELMRILSGGSIESSETQDETPVLIDKPEISNGSTDATEIIEKVITGANVVNGTNINGGQTISQIIDEVLVDSPQANSKNMKTKTNGSMTGGNVGGNIKSNVGGNIEDDESTETTATPSNTRTITQDPSHAKGNETTNTSESNELDAPKTNTNDIKTSLKEDDIFGQIYADSKNEPDDSDFKLDEVPNAEINVSDYSDNETPKTDKNIDEEYEYSDYYEEESEPQNKTDEFNEDFDPNDYDSGDDEEEDENDNDFASKYIKIINELKTDGGSLSLKGAGTINKRVRIVNAFPYIIKSSTTE